MFSASSQKFGLHNTILCFIPEIYHLFPTLSLLSLPHLRLFLSIYISLSLPVHLSLSLFLSLLCSYGHNLFIHQVFTHHYYGYFEIAFTWGRACKVLLRVVDVWVTIDCVSLTYYGACSTHVCQTRTDFGQSNQLCWSSWWLGNNNHWFFLFFICLHFPSL